MSEQTGRHFTCPDVGHPGDFPPASSGDGSPRKAIVSARVWVADSHAALQDLEQELGSDQRSASTHLGVLGDTRFRLCAFVK